MCLRTVARAAEPGPGHTVGQEQETEREPRRPGPRDGAEGHVTGTTARRSVRRRGRLPRTTCAGTSPPLHTQSCPWGIRVVAHTHQECESRPRVGRDLGTDGRRTATGPAARAAPTTPRVTRGSPGVRLLRGRGARASDAARSRESPASARRSLLSRRSRPCESNFST